jgi:hypothetical protein
MEVMGYGGFVWRSLSERQLKALGLVGSFGIGLHDSRRGDGEIGFVWELKVERR